MKSRTSSPGWVKRSTMATLWMQKPPPPSTNWLSFREACVFFLLFFWPREWVPLRQGFFWILRPFFKNVVSRVHCKTLMNLMHYFGFMGVIFSTRIFMWEELLLSCNLFDEIMHQVLIPLLYMWDALDVIKNARPETMRWCRDPLLIWRLQATDMANTLVWWC